MAKQAASVQTTPPAAGFRPLGANVVDMRTRRRWRPPAEPTWPFLLDVVITFTVVVLGTWLFYKMRGG